MAVLVEPVQRRGRVVDQFGQPVPAAGLLQVDQQARQFAGRHHARLRQRRRLADHRVGLGEVGARRFAGVAEALQRHRQRFGERGQGLGRVGQRGGGGAEVFEDRGAGVGKGLEAGHRLPELAQEGGELLQRRFQFRPLFGARLGGGPGVGDEAGDVAALARERPQDFLRVARQLRQLVALGREDAEGAVDVAQDRVRPLDQHFDVFAAAGQAGAEFVEDQPEALRVGQGVDVVDQVGVDAGAVVAERQQVLAGPRFAGGDLLQRRRRFGPRRPRQGRLAVDELLADQRLRPDQAACVLPPVLEARVGDVHDDDRLARLFDRLAVLVGDRFPGHGDADFFDFADVGARHPHLLAVDHEGAVVEDRPHPVAAGFAAARDQEDDRDDGRDHCCCE